MCAFRELGSNRATNHPRPAIIAAALVSVLGLLPAVASAAVWKDRRVPGPSTTAWDDFRFNKILNPSIAPGMVVWVCKEHLPLGSQVRTNLQTVVDRYNAIPGLAFHLVVLELPGTETHIEWTDVDTHRPAYGMMVDWDTLPNSAAVGGAGDVCTRPDPASPYLHCTHGGIRFSRTSFDEYPVDDDDAPSVAVIAHEMGHVIGFQHAGSGPVDYSSMWFARPTHKTHHHHGDLNAQLSNEHTALVYRFMSEYYGWPDSELGQDELAMHAYFYTEDAVNGYLTEWTPDRSHRAVAGKNPVPLNNAEVDTLNRTRLIWNAVSARYEDCHNPGLRPQYIAQFSELSDNTSNTYFKVAIDVSTTPTPGVSWTRVARRTGVRSHVAGKKFRQLEWRKFVTITGADVDIADPETTGGTRHLLVTIDPDNQVDERDENNNSYMLELDLIAGNSACP